MRPPSFQRCLQAATAVAPRGLRRQPQLKSRRTATAARRIAPLPGSEGAAGFALWRGEPQQRLQQQQHGGHPLLGGQVQRRWGSAQRQEATSQNSDWEWRLYAALEKKDEAAHVALVRFVEEFQELQAVASEDLGKREETGKGPDDGDRDVVVTLQGYHESVRLPKRITSKVATDMITRFKEGAVLAATDLERLLHQTAQVLQSEPVVRRLPAPRAAGSSVVVVGDLHGSISDLAAVLRICGPPGLTTYIFNGDFVDRGQHSAEVVATLCALKLAHPQHVHLNRGNHECKALTRSYGLQHELRAKYRGQAAFAVFKEMCSFFSALPLVVVVGGERGDHVNAVVLHGGPPSDLGADLRKIELTAVRDESTAQVVGRSKKDAAPKQVSPNAKILEDLLWSDPVHEDTSATMSPNKMRNAGTRFGLGAVDAFLKRERLTTLVRSHEVVFAGVERLETGEGTEMYTVFSASHYPDKRGRNSAAALRFVPPREPSDRVGLEESSGLSSAEIVRWETSAEDEPGAEVDTTTCRGRAAESQQTLYALIARHRHRIHELCHKAEKRARAAGQQGDLDAGFLKQDLWSATMSSWGDSVGLALPARDWQILLPVLQSIGSSELKGQEQADAVNYRGLFEGFSIEMVDREGKPDVRGLSTNTMMSLYENHKELSMIFAWMDADNSGALSLEEVKQACEVLNERAINRGAQPVDPEALFRAMDIDGSGSLDRYEFMECFRLVAKDVPRRAG